MEIIFKCELFVVAFFSVEYIIRLLTSRVQYKEKGVLAPFYYIFSFIGLIDLLSILPFYAPLIITTNLTFLRIFRLFRLLRIFKLLRYSSSISILGRAIGRIKTELLSTLFIAFIVLLLSANVMYVIENEAQPEAFANMGEALWWAVATLTTVGYGDVYPITYMGKFLSGIIAIIGIGIVAIPTGLLSSAFMTELQERKEQKEPPLTCPHCNKQLHNQKLLRKKGSC